MGDELTYWIKLKGKMRNIFPLLESDKEFADNFSLYGKKFLREYFSKNPEKFENLPSKSQPHG